MIEAYRGFFGASATAAAAFLGLLFVALSFIDAERVDDKDRVWRGIMAGSAFAQLVNVFFVSLMGLTPGIKSLAFTGCVMAVFGLFVAFRLLFHTVDSERTGRNRPSVLGIVAVGAYTLQLVTGILLLRNSNSQTVMDWFIAALIILYAGALARAWEITGLKRR